MVTPKPAETPESAAAEKKSAASPPLSFEVLAAGRTEVIIEHRGQEYRLRSTRNGGLILNK